MLDMLASGTGTVVERVGGSFGVHGAILLFTPMQSSIGSSQRSAFGVDGAFADLSETGCGSVEEPFGEPGADAHRQCRSSWRGPFKNDCVDVPDDHGQRYYWNRRTDTTSCTLPLRVSASGSRFVAT